MPADLSWGFGTFVSEQKAGYGRAPWVLWGVPGVPWGSLGLLGVTLGVPWGSLEALGSQNLPKWTENLAKIVKS